MKLTNKQKRSIKRRVQLEQGVSTPGTRVFVSKKIYTRKKKHRMKEIDNMLDQWIHSSIIRAKLRELIVKENFKSFDLGVEHKKELK